MHNASKRLRLNFNKKKGICDDLLASNSQCQTTENNVGAEGHKWQVKVGSIDIMARWLIFQAPSYLLCNPCPMTLQIASYEDSISLTWTCLFSKKLKLQFVVTILLHGLTHQRREVMK
jgi:hypothetical protein